MNVRLARLPLAILAVCGLTLTGCSEDNPEEKCLAADGLVVVVGIHRGAPAALSPVVGCMIGSTLAAGKPVAVVGVGPDPTRIQGPVAFSRNDFKTQRAFLATVTDAGNGIITKIKLSEPNADGADLLAAMAYAADMTRSGLFQGRNVTALVADSGLSDTGAVNLARPGGLQVRPEATVDAIVKTKNCPRLKGVTVRFTQLGYAPSASGQQTLTPADQDVVRATYTGLVTSCGGTAVDESAPVGDTAWNTTHTVIPVLPSAWPHVDLAHPQTYRGDNSPFSFPDDKTTFARPDLARAELQKVVDDLIADPGLDLTITGTTADGHTRYPSLPDLGKARAEAVKDLVLAMSEGQITATRITTIGKGYTATPPQVDVVTAALNRSVTLTYSN